MHVHRLVRKVLFEYAVEVHCVALPYLLPALCEPLMCGLSRDGPALVVDRQLRVLVGFVDDLAKVVCRVHALLLPEVERRANHGNVWLFTHNLVSPVCDSLRHLLDEGAILWIRVLRRNVELHANLLVPEEHRVKPLLADPTVFALKPLLLV